MTRTRTKIETRGRRPTSRDGGERYKQHIRFSEAEWEFVRERAELQGVTISAYVRRLCLRGMPYDNPDACP